MKMIVLNIFKYIFLFFVCSTFHACSFNVSMAHTSGSAEDVIDDTATNSPTVSPHVTVPLTPGSSINLMPN